MFTRFLATTCVLHLSITWITAANGAVIITQTAMPTVDMPGYTTYVLTADVESGDKIAGFDFTGGNNGFFGPMNQINPAGNRTVFNIDITFFLALGLNPFADSHFKFNSGEGIVVGDEEGPNTLQAAMSFGTANAKSTPLAFVQLAIPDGETVVYRGNFTVLTPTGPILEDVSGIVPIPEPSTFALIGLALVGLIGYARRKIHCSRHFGAVVSNGIKKEE